MIFNRIYSPQWITSLLSPIFGQTENFAPKKILSQFSILFIDFLFFFFPENKQQEDRTTELHQETQVKQTTQDKGSR